MGGEKDAKSRKFLSDLKRVVVEYNDLPTNYLYQEYEKFLIGDETILFLQIREIEEIEKIKERIRIPCVTLLISRNDCGRKTSWGNTSDDDVDLYHYDYYYENDTSLLELTEIRFMKLIQEILQSQYIL